MQHKNVGSFLADPRVKRVLSSKPGQEGFSLIELVVVIAVLAILAAVALPNFLGVQKDGQVATAKNTLATIVKECVASGLRGGGTSFASVQSSQGKLNGYTLSSLGSGAADTCYGGVAVGEGDLADYVISYNTNTGATAKTCSAGGTDYVNGCYASAGLLSPVAAGAVSGGSW